MSGLVLIVGALMVAAGGYEMIAGSGDILSERGWSAFIAGSVFISGGVVTMALGLAVRALERFDAPLVREPAVPMVDRLEPAAFAVAPAAALESLREPPVNEAPTAPVLAAPPIEHAAVETHAEATLESAAAHDLAAEPGPRHDDWLDQSFAELEREATARHEPAMVPEAGHHETDHVGAAPPEATPIAEPPAPAAAEHHDAPPRDAEHHAEHHDAEHHDAVHHDALHHDALHHDALHHDLDDHAEMAAAHDVAPVAAAHEAEAHQSHADDHAAGHHEASPEHATVSAREEAEPPTAAVIGRYESEGTSYVMYADGSIDAQSEAGVYRFASMSELKAFIES